jgi:GTP cyclohydrolase I
MYVDLPHHFKGTHMSRFIEILDAYREKIALDKMEVILQKMKEKLGASSAHLEIEFPYFIEKKALSARGSWRHCNSAARETSIHPGGASGHLALPLSKELPVRRTHAAARSIMTVQVRCIGSSFTRKSDRGHRARARHGYTGSWKRRTESSKEHASQNPRFVEVMVQTQP